MERETTICNWNKCKSTDNLSIVENVLVCSYHKEGGVFNTGKLYEQYSIIEEDFITILKYIPLQKQNFDITSPRFSDLLIRSCVAIEIFFREWINDYKLLDENLNEIRAKKKLNFNDFFKVFNSRLNESNIFVRDLNENIAPFSCWEEHAPPSWWQCYNNIKHHNIDKQNVASMKMALDSLAALFILQCEQVNSLSYLYKYSNVNLVSVTWMRLKIIKTPLESKLYLFHFNVPSKSPAHNAHY